MVESSERSLCEVNSDINILHGIKNSREEQRPYMGKTEKTMKRETRNEKQNKNETKEQEIVWCFWLRYCIRWC